MKQKAAKDGKTKGEGAKAWLAAILKGKLLLRLKVDKYLPQIVFFFLCAVTYIGLSLGIESALHEREENVKLLDRLESIHVEVFCRLTSLYSVCQVEDLLKSMGSELRMPTDKAVILE